MAADYTADTEFVSTFVHEQTPILMSMVALLSGRKHRFPASGFTYCDFGCGTGLNLCFLAASNPQGEFYGVDFISEHIDSAKALAERTGLTNVTFIDASFDDLTPEDLPDLDYAIIAHTYSWVPPKTRVNLISYIKNSLKRSGLLYIYYGAMPGISATLATTTLTQLLAQRHEGPNASRVVKAIKELNDILSGNPALKFNGLLPQARETLENELQVDPDHLAHDLLNRSPEALWFHQVAQDFAAHGLEFVGHARPRLNAFGDLYEPALTKAYNDFCNTEDDPVLREEILNLVCNTSVRIDIFGKDTPFLPADQSPDFSNLYFHGLYGHNHRAARDRAQSVVSIDLAAPVYDDILNAVADGFAEAEKLVSDCNEKYGAAVTRRALMHLIGMDLMSFGPLPLITDSQDLRLNPSAFDRFALFETMHVSKPSPLPSTIMASCLKLSRIERICLAGLISDDLRDVWTLIERHKIPVAKQGGGAMTSYADFEAVFPEILKSFEQQRLPDLLTRGLLS